MVFLDESIAKHSSSTLILLLIHFHIAIALQASVGVMEGDRETPLQCPHITLDTFPLRNSVVGECRSDGGRLRSTPTVPSYS